MSQLSDNPHPDFGHLLVQSEHHRDEGTWWFVEALTYKGAQMIRHADIQTMFLGREAKQRAEAAHREILRREEET